MALRKDFIVRQLEEFGKVMSVILGLKLNKDWDEFETEIAAAAKKYTNLEIDAVENMSDADFEISVLYRDGMELDQKKILAQLLFEKLNFYIASGNEENYSRLKDRCLVLYNHILQNFTENEFDLDVHYKIAALRMM